jgi:hypothetical protein
MSIDTGEQWTPIEFIPVDVYDPSTWTFRFDAERPTWADDAWLESATREMRNRAEGLIVRNPQKIITGRTLIFGDKSSAKACVACRIVAVHRGANLVGASLDGASLAGANLSGATLERANLEWANLAGANLEWANLAGANLAGANLDGANLDGAKRNARAT